MQEHKSKIHANVLPDSRASSIVGRHDIVSIPISWPVLVEVVMIGNLSLEAMYMLLEAHGGGRSAWDSTLGLKSAESQLGSSRFWSLILGNVFNQTQINSIWQIIAKILKWKIDDHKP